MATVNDILLKIRDDLDELTTGAGAQWSDTQLKRWMNQARNDLATVTKLFESTVDVAVTAGVAEVTVPATVIEINHVYFLPTGDTRAIPLDATHFEAGDQVWGSWQNIRQGDPAMFAPWGYSPNLKLRLYPVPSRAGNIRIYHAKQPAAIVEDNATNNTTYDMPDFYVEAVIFYVIERALRRDRNQDWQVFAVKYQEKRAEIAGHQHTSHAREIVHDYWSGGVPRHLSDFDYDYGY